MKTLQYLPTDDTPKIELNKDDNIFIIVGRSLPENVHTFYTPVYEWFEEYIKNPNKTTKLHIQLDYYNTTSAKQFSKIFNLLAHIKNSLTIKWYYYTDDIDMLEDGIRYSRLTGIKFDLIEETEAIF